MSTGAPETTDLVTLTIDGVAVSVPKGTLVIRAAEQIGIQIPRFCDHPLLAPVGACRQCLVEVALPGPDGELRQMQGPPGRMKPQASCTLTASEGMQVNTQLTSPGADKAQRGVMEALLINHPLDCPVCDKGGECPLQNQAMSNGQGESRFADTGGTKRTFAKPINISEQILLDRERCIVCQRCTRFADEVAGDPFIELIERGAYQQIGIAEGVPFNSYFSGNVIQICPVGALTSAEYRFRSRPFDLVSSPGVTEHDSSGAAIRVDHRRGKVVRRMAGNDPEVNEEWITDKDRFAFQYTRSADRLGHPLVRDADTGELRAASWPEAFVVAARGLAAARDGGGVGVLTGGRLIAEDAYAYSKFARTVLGTNDIDFRARPHSAEEAAFLASEVVGTMPVTYRDLEQASTVLLVGLEPEDEAGSIFLRLRKAQQAGAIKVVTVAPFTTRGSAKLRAEVVSTAPGEEAEALATLDGQLDGNAVILVGERLASGSGAYAAAVRLARSTGARLAWVPRRAGDRGALEAGCLPGLLPGGRPVGDAAARVDVATAWGVDPLPERPGRDTTEILSALREKTLAGVVVAGVSIDDLPDPAAARDALQAASFVVALDLRNTEITELADVVFPVAPTSHKAGTFVNWEGRPRSFAAALSAPGVLPDLRSLAGIAEEMGTTLGFRTVAEAQAEMAEVGAWDGARAPAVEAPSAKPRRLASNRFWLASWKLLLDNGLLQEGDKAMAATARPAVAKVSASTANALQGARAVTLTGDRGEVTVPVEVADIADDVVWLPANSLGRGVLADLASPGSAVTVKGAQL
ncbi:NADH-quinone oxidoreductase subunit G [Nocardioides sp. Bht2]|uniref:NADH-quinone oxidoreductase subunit G n=1 Tax=Nocardioides sp. Bht2 TaxID=3392297 RepID=UPI0039B3BAE1